jgi:hypothetical protein
VVDKPWTARPDDAIRRPKRQSIVTAFDRVC